jgi:hypothetical protein
LLIQDIIPILSTTLADPFTPSNPLLLLSTILCLQTVLLNCWPRISEPRYKLEIIKALCVCWKDVSKSEDSGSLEDVKKELKVTGQLLISAVEGEMDIRAELEPLMAVDTGVAVLFGLDERST